MAQLTSQALVPPSVRFETLYGGRTNRVWKVLGGANDAVLKLYCAPFDNPLFRNDAALEVTCLRALKTTGFVPNLRATGEFDADNWVLYDHAPGAPWEEETSAVARLLRDLHDLPVQVSAPVGCNGSTDLADHARRILMGCRSDQKSRLEQQVPQTYVTPTRRTCLIHGDPVAGNILVSRTGLTLIDWQCPAIGDPCEDLAIFLSPAMQQIYRGVPLTQEEIDQFLTAYGRPEITERYLLLRPW